MSEYIFDVVNQTSKLDWAFAFQRTGAFPLDRSSLFSSLADAEAYAKGDKSDARGLGGSSYVGQPVSVYNEENNTVSLYIIDGDRSLKEVGSGSAATITTDDASIVVVDGKVQLKDFGSHYYAYIPAIHNEQTGEIITPATYELVEGFKENLEPRIRFEDNKYFIAWYEPNKEIDFLKDDIISLENITNDIKEQIGSPVEGQSPATGLYAELNTKANKADVYTKTEVEGLIAQADHLKRITVAGIESINVHAQDAEQFIYMVPNVETGNYDEYMVIDGDIEKVGDWKVDLSDYAKAADVNNALNNKVDKVDNARLITEIEAQKLANLKENAEENYVKSISNDFNISNGYLSLADIPQSKVVDLTTTLNSKVSKKDNYDLIHVDQLTKLSNIKDLIQSVDTEKFTIDDNGQLLLNSIQIDEIDDLNIVLSGKVDKVNGSRLITEAEAQKLEKLVFNEETGEVEISGSVNATNVQELYDNVVRIVQGTGNYIYDGVSRPLLGIQTGAEKNIINAIDNNQFSIGEDDRKLSIKAINIETVTGLQTALNEKATTTFVTNVVDQLNAQYASYEARIAGLEGRLIWQPLIDNNFA